MCNNLPKLYARLLCNAVLLSSKYAVLDILGQPPRFINRIIIRTSDINESLNQGCPEHDCDLRNRAVQFASMYFTRYLFSSC